MYRNISLEEGNYVLSEIEKQLNKENIELDLEQQIKTLDVYADSIKELTTKGYEVTEFTKIASLCNAGFIFPFTKDEEKNLSSHYSRSFNHRSYGWKRVRGRHRSAG